MERFFTFRPGTGAAVLRTVHPSEDGRFIALGVLRPQADPFSASVCEWTWMLDTSDGSLRALDRHHVAPSSWVNSDVLCVTGRQNVLASVRSESRDGRFWCIDAHTLEKRESLRPPLPERQLLSIDGLGCLWIEDGRRTTFRIAEPVKCFAHHAPRVLVSREPDRLVVQDLRTHDEIVLDDTFARIREVLFSADDRRVVVAGRDGVRVFDSASGARVAWPIRQEAMLRACSGAERSFLLVTTLPERDSFVIDAADGRVVVGPIEGLSTFWAAARNGARFVYQSWCGGHPRRMFDLDAGTSALLDPDVQGLHVVDADHLYTWTHEHIDEIDARGKVLRRLYPR